MNRDESVFEMVFGNKNTIFKKFIIHSIEEEKYLKATDGFVNLTSEGFADEWKYEVDYNNSKACIKDGKLHIFVYGLPDYLNKSKIKKYFKETLDQYIEQEYGEFFETLPGWPICMTVESNSLIKTV